MKPDLTVDSENNNNMEIGFQPMEIDSIQIKHIPETVRQDLATQLEPPRRRGCGWKLVAEQFGLSQDEISLIDSKQCLGGTRTLELLGDPLRDSYIGHLRNVLWNIGFQDTLMKLEHGRQAIIQSYRNSIKDIPRREHLCPDTGNHLPFTYHKHVPPHMIGLDNNHIQHPTPGQSDDDGKSASMSINPTFPANSLAHSPHAAMTARQTDKPVDLTTKGLPVNIMDRFLSDQLDSVRNKPAAEPVYDHRDHVPQPAEQVKVNAPPMMKNVNGQHHSFIQPSLSESLSDTSHMSSGLSSGPSSGALENGYGSKVSKQRNQMDSFQPGNVQHHSTQPSGKLPSSGVPFGSLPEQSNGYSVSSGYPLSNKSGSFSSASINGTSGHDFGRQAISGQSSFGATINNDRLAGPGARAKPNQYPSHSKMSPGGPTFQLQLSGDESSISANVPLGNAHCKLQGAPLVSSFSPSVNSTESSGPKSRMHDVNNAQRNMGNMFSGHQTMQAPNHLLYNGRFQQSMPIATSDHMDQTTSGGLISSIKEEKMDCTSSCSMLVNSDDQSLRHPSKIEQSFCGHDPLHLTENGVPMEEVLMRNQYGPLWSSGSMERDLKDAKVTPMEEEKPDLTGLQIKEEPEWSATNMETEITSVEYGDGANVPKIAQKTLPPISCVFHNHQTSPVAKVNANLEATASSNQSSRQNFGPSRSQDPSHTSYSSSRSFTRPPSNAPLNRSLKPEEDEKASEDKKFFTVPRSHKEEIQYQKRAGLTQEPLRNASSADEKVQSSPTTQDFRKVNLFVTFAWPRRAGEKNHLRVARMTKNLCCNGFRVASQECPPQTLTDSNMSHKQWIDSCYKKADFVLVCVCEHNYKALVSDVPCSNIHGQLSMNPFHYDTLDTPEKRTKYIYSLIQEEFLQRSVEHSRIIVIQMKGAKENRSIPPLLTRFKAYKWPFEYDDLMYYLIRPYRVVDQFLTEQGTYSLNPQQVMRQHSLTGGDRDENRCYTVPL